MRPVLRQPSERVAAVYVHCQAVRRANWRDGAELAVVERSGDFRFRHQTGALFQNGTQAVDLYTGMLETTARV